MPEVASTVSDPVHEDTQNTDRGFDLTLDSIARVQEPAQVDFGGGELADPTLIEEVAERRSADDDYGWWDLDAGTYLLTYNETIDTDHPLRLEPRTALTKRGAFHPTLSITELHRVPMTTADIQLKENARVSTLFDPTTRE